MRAQRTTEAGGRESSNDRESRVTVALFVFSGLFPTIQHPLKDLQDVANNVYAKCTQTAAYSVFIFSTSVGLTQFRSFL